MSESDCRLRRPLDHSRPPAEPLGLSRPHRALTTRPTLCALPAGQRATVHAVHAPDHSPEWQQHLMDLGFVPGEHVQVLRRAAMGGDPLVVRVGGSTYALRKAEAACVQLQASTSGP